MAIFDGWLAGLPVNVTVQSEREAIYSDKYTLSWTVRSLSPIVSYQLQLQVLSDSVSQCLYVHLQNKFVRFNYGKIHKIMNRLFRSQLDVCVCGVWH